MRRFSALVTLTLLLTLALGPAAQANPVSSPFNGAWIGHDPAPPQGDGSAVHLVITGGPNVRVAFTDEFGSVCVNAGASETFFTSILTGHVEGNVLSADFRIARCGSTIIAFLRGETATYEYDDNGTSDPSDDVLWDGFVLWSRDT